LANTPSVRIASASATETAPSLRMAIYRLQQLTEAMERRLARVETSQRSLRRRVMVNQQVVQ
jgi:hypothetical protein